MKSVQMTLVLLLHPLSALRLARDATSASLCPHSAARWSAGVRPCFPFAVTVLTLLTALPLSLVSDLGLPPALRSEGQHAPSRDDTIALTKRSGRASVRESEGDERGSKGAHQGVARRRGRIIDEGMERRTRKHTPHHDQRRADENGQMAQRSTGACNGACTPACPAPRPTALDRAGPCRSAHYGGGQGRMYLVLYCIVFGTSNGLYLPFLPYLLCRGIHS